MAHPTPDQYRCPSMAGERPGSWPAPSPRYTGLMENKRPEAKGRGSQLNPPNRFGGPVHVLDLAEVEHDQEYLDSLRNRPTEYLPDHSRTIVSREQ